MKIILGCDPLLQPLTGIGHYTKQLANGLKIKSGIDELKLFDHGKFFSTELLGDKISTNKITTQNALSIIRGKLATSEYIVKLYQSVLPYITHFALKNYSDFIYHSPNFILPEFSGKKVVTIHDLSTIKFPEYHPKSRVSFVNHAIKNALENSDHIITDSQFVKAELVKYLGGNKDKISSIPLGADASFFVRNTFECQNVTYRYNINYKEFFLFVSTIEPRKNLLNLLTSFEQYRQRNINGFPLILVGGKGWNNQDILEKIETLEEKGLIKYLGYVPQRDIPLLYSAARALLFPSRYEGFGLPVLEAMQSGTPVLTSVNSAMSEITGEYGGLVNIDNIDEMSGIIEKLAIDQDWSQQLVDLGLKRSTQFSWQNCVNSTFKVYQSLS